ncbi:hypothetical protein [Bacillus sp. 1P06AnD]|uniref:hypothetical protein n=1 Tax=Bacillus sp. 1P06AnD TaxID=3132208 RepID=UPI00399F408C
MKDNMTMASEMISMIDEMTDILDGLEEKLQLAIEKEQTVLYAKQLASLEMLADECSDLEEASKKELSKHAKTINRTNTSRPEYSYRNAHSL